MPTSYNGFSSSFGFMKSVTPIALALSTKKIQYIIQKGENRGRLTFQIKL